LLARIGASPRRRIAAAACALVSLAAYDAIRAVSPETLVGPVFQYEHLSGLGRLAAMTAPNWGALAAHDLGRVEVLGLSF
jgi:hypothetical protein